MTRPELTVRPLSRPDPGSGAAGQRLRVLLIEDDPADAFLVEELLEEAEAPVVLKTAGSMREAVAEGAQDYLVKGRVDGILLSRAIRYAVERRRADDNVRRLREAELRQAESARLERGLLPKPLIEPGVAALETFYRPGRERALLGGDFFDAVQTGPGRLSLLVGDVCGHGAEEAALGVALRVAWRALTLAGVPEGDLLAALERVLMSERRSEEIFATVATVSVDVPAGQATVRLCGHPPPLLIAGSTVRPLSGTTTMMLGVLPGQATTPARVPLPDGWAILVYTDGLIEGRVADGRLGVSGLCQLVGVHRRTGRPLSELPGWLFSQAEERNGGPLADDVAMLLLTGDDTG